MFKRQEVEVLSQPYCSKLVDELSATDFLYYDVDGFELSRAEQKFYSAMDYPISYPILNHCCWQEPWYELADNTDGLLLHHAMILHRCDYTGEAADQLKTLQKTIPWANQLLNTRAKWGFDFNLYGVADNATVFEIIHIEYDNTDYYNFIQNLLSFEFIIKHTDWYDAADKIWNHRDKWQSLKGFDQNHWKAKFLIGWDKAEVIEKAS
jgi:hypothetical protein